MQNWKAFVNGNRLLKQVVTPITVAVPDFVSVIEQINIAPAHGMWLVSWQYFSLCHLSWTTRSSLGWQQKHVIVLFKAMPILPQSSRLEWIWLLYYLTGILGFMDGLVTNELTEEELTKSLLIPHSWQNMKYLTKFREIYLSGVSTDPVV